MSSKPSNIPSFSSPVKSFKTIGIIKNTSNNQRIISDPTANVDRQSATTVLKRVSFYLPEGHSNNISTRIQPYPKDKYVTKLKNDVNIESNSLGSKLGNKIDGVIKMGCKLTNKLDNVIRASGKYDKPEMPRFEVNIDSSKLDNVCELSNDKKKKYTSASKAMDLDRSYALKWESRHAKLYTPIRNSDKDIVLNDYKVHSSKDGSKKSILHSLKYTLDNSDCYDSREKWLWDIISNKKVNESTCSADYESKRDDLLDGFEIFCNQMAQGAGSNLVDLLVNDKKCDVENSELIRDYKGSGNDVLQQGSSVYVIPDTISTSKNCTNFHDESVINETGTNNTVFMPLGGGIWRWATSVIPVGDKKCKSTQTNEDDDSIILDTTLGPGFEFIYSTNTNEIYQLVCQDVAKIPEDCEIYNLASTTKTDCTNTI